MPTMEPAVNPPTIVITSNEDVEESVLSVCLETMEDTVKQPNGSCAAATNQQHGTTAQPSQGETIAEDEATSNRSDSLKDQLKIDLQKLDLTPRPPRPPAKPLDTNKSSGADNSQQQQQHTSSRSIARRVVLSLTLTTLVVMVLCAYLLYMLYEGELDTVALAELRYREDVLQFEEAFYRPLRDRIVVWWRDLVDWYHRL